VNSDIYLHGNSESADKAFGKQLTTLSSILKMYSLSEMMQSISTFKTSKAPDVSNLDIVTAPGTALRQALSSIEVPSFLYEGIPVMKVTSGGATAHRILTLSSDHQAFFITHKKVKTARQKMVAHLASTLPIPLWTPRKGFSFTNETKLRDRYVRHLDIADIDTLVEGVAGSQEFESLHLQRDRQVVAVTIYHHGMSEALNLFITNPEHRRAVVDVARKMKTVYYQTLPFLSCTSMLLRYLWYYVDQDQSGNISSKEFKHICGIINLQVTANKYFDEATRRRTGELTYLECMQLLLRIQEDLSPPPDAWKAMFGEVNQGAISPNAMLTGFLHGPQGEISKSIEDAQVNSHLLFVQNEEIALTQDLRRPSCARLATCELYYLLRPRFTAPSDSWRPAISKYTNLHYRATVSRISHVGVQLCL
jgi:hypothetical protein